ncbi:Uncharacterised protein at_DN0504 [Pycnogonum litorale]
MISLVPWPCHVARLCEHNGLILNRLIKLRDVRYSILFPIADLSDSQPHEPGRLMQVIFLQMFRARDRSKLIFSFLLYFVKMRLAKTNSLEQRGTQRSQLLQLCTIAAETLTGSIDVNNLFLSALISSYRIFMVTSCK